MLTYDNIIGTAQHELVIIAEKLYDSKKEGKAEKDLLRRGVKITQYLRLLSFKEGIDSDKIEQLLNCLMIVANIKDFRLANSIQPTKYNLIGGVVQTVAVPGSKGDPGDNANIIVELKAAESRLELEETNVDGVKTYTLSSVEYVEPSLILSIVGGETIFEVGQSVNIQLRVQAIKGSKLLESTNIVEPERIDLSPGFDGDEVVIDGGVTEEVIYTVITSDGTTSIGKTLPIKFYYPILSGKHSLSSVNPYTLTKYVGEKKNIDLIFNPEDEYFTIAHLASLGSSEIHSHNRNDVTDAFVKTIENVTSSGYETEGGNWTESYVIYRLPYKTSGINNYFKLVFTDG